jgi:hypothetical protein
MIPLRSVKISVKCQSMGQTPTLKIALLSQEIQYL